MNLEDIFSVHHRSWPPRHSEKEAQPYKCRDVAPMTSSASHRTLANCQAAKGLGSDGDGLARRLAAPEPCFVLFFNFVLYLTAVVCMLKTPPIDPRLAASCAGMRRYL